MTAIPRFDAQNFTTLSTDMHTAFERDGVLVLEGLIPATDCDGLRARMDEMVQNFDYGGHATRFSSTSAAHANEDQFLTSGDKIDFFFEEDAFGPDGSLRVAPQRALNKVGHAMHDLDPVFSRFSRRSAFKAIAEGLDIARPLLLQSMYIFKHPGIGGEVLCHQDSTYLWTEPASCIGIWVALEDATIENGCLWGIPGGAEANRQTPPKARFRRTETGGTETITLDSSPFRETEKQPLEAPKGTVLVFGGAFPHMSAANRSDMSRHAYTLHLIDGAAKYPPDNWLRRPEHLPLRGF